MPRKTAEQKVADHLASGPKLRQTLDCTGSPSLEKAVNAMRKDGRVVIVDHPTVKDPWGYPAPCYALAEAKAATREG